MGEPVAQGPDRMSVAFLIACVWLTICCIVGMIPHRNHKPHAVMLLLPFPFILAAVAWDLGFWWALALFAAALSIFRYPALWLGKFIWGKVKG